MQQHSVILCFIFTVEGLWCLDGCNEWMKRRHAEVEWNSRVLVSFSSTDWCLYNVTASNQWPVSDVQHSQVQHNHSWAITAIPRVRDLWRAINVDRKTKCGDHVLDFKILVQFLSFSSWKCVSLYPSLFPLQSFSLAQPIFFIVLIHMNMMASSHAPHLTLWWSHCLLDSGAQVPMFNRSNSLFWPIWTHKHTRSHCYRVI